MKALTLGVSLCNASKEHMAGAVTGQGELPSVGTRRV